MKGNQSHSQKTGKEENLLLIDLLGLAFRITKGSSTERKKMIIERVWDFQKRENQTNIEEKTAQWVALTMGRFVDQGMAR